jgi:hypothetical protein
MRIHLTYGSGRDQSTNNMGLKQVCSAAVAVLSLRCDHPIAVDITVPCFLRFPRNLE